MVSKKLFFLMMVFLVFSAQAQEEPTYQGKTTREWILVMDDAHEPTVLSAVEALVALTPRDPRALEGLLNGCQRILQRHEIYLEWEFFPWEEIGAQFARSAEVTLPALLTATEVGLKADPAGRLNETTPSTEWPAETSKMIVALGILRGMESHARPAIPRLAELLDQGDAAEQRALLVSMKKIEKESFRKNGAPDEPDVITILKHAAPLLDGDDPSVRKAVVELVAAMSPRPRPMAAPVPIDSPKRPEKKCCPWDDRVSELLGRSLRDTDTEVQFAALYALWEMGSRARGAVPAVKAALEEEQPGNIREGMEDLLDKISGGN